MSVQRVEKTDLNMLPTQPLKASLLLLVVVGLSLGIGLAAAHQMTLVAFAAIAALLAVAIFLWPDAATLLFIFITYSNIAVIGVRFHGLPAIVPALLSGLLLPPLLYHLVIRREKIIIPSNMLWISLFMVVLMISTILSDNVETAFSELLTYLTEGFILYFLMVNVIRSIKQVRIAIWILLMVGIILGSVPLYQQVTKTFKNNYGGLAQISNASFSTGGQTFLGAVRQERLAGVIGEINRFAQIMLMLVPLGLFRFWGEKSRLLRLIALLSAGLSGIGVVLTFSRGAAVAFAILILLMVFFRIIKPIQLLAFVLIAVLLVIAMPQYTTRLLSLQSVTNLFNQDSAGTANSPDGAILGRATEMIAAAQVYSDYPVFGVGPGMFKYYSRQYSYNIGIRYLTMNREAHSLYLAIAAESGTLGIICFLAMLYVTLRDLMRVRKRSKGVRPDLENLATSFILVLFSYLTTGIFLHFSYQRYFWIMFALATSVGYYAKKELDASFVEPANPIPVDEKV